MFFLPLLPDGEKVAAWKMKKLLYPEKVVSLKAFKYKT